MSQYTQDAEAHVFVPRQIYCLPCCKRFGAHRAEVDVLLKHEVSPSLCYWTEIMRKVWEISLFSYFSPFPKQLTSLLPAGKELSLPLLPLDNVVRLQYPLDITANYKWKMCQGTSYFSPYAWHKLKAILHHHQEAFILWCDCQHTGRLILANCRWADQQQIFCLW